MTDFVIDDPPLPPPATQCEAVDGDTLRCSEIGRVRLLGIDAPEMPGHCRKGRACAPGDPRKSKAHLAKLIRAGVTIDPVTRDRYGRTVAQVYAGDRNIACAQLRAGLAMYVAKWDNGRRLARECKAALKPLNHRAILNSYLRLARMPDRPLPVYRR